MLNLPDGTSDSLIEEADRIIAIVPVQFDGELNRDMLRSAQRDNFVFWLQR